jgi:glutathione S-transferase
MLSSCTRSLNLQINCFSARIILLTSSKAFFSSSHRKFNKMPKLYYTPTSCGSASFISAMYGGLKIDCEQVDLKSHKTLTSGQDFYTINPKGNVPTLVLDDGTVLNENAAVLQWIADHVSLSFFVSLIMYAYSWLSYLSLFFQTTNPVAPPNGSVERSLVQNQLSFVSSEIHATVGPLFAPGLSPDLLNFFKDRFNKKAKYLNDTMLGNGQQFIVGNNWTIVDAYLGVVLSWHPYLSIDLSPFPNVTAYLERVSHLPHVKAAAERMKTNPCTTI